MSTEIVALIALLMVRAVIPVAVLLTLSSALRRWDERRANM